MRNRPTLTTVLRRVGEFNTSLIAHLKLPKKSIITRSQHEKNEKKNAVSNPQLGRLPGRVIKLVFYRTGGVGSGNEIVVSHVTSDDH